MKKVFVLLMVMLFVVSSVSFVVADESKDSDATKEGDGTTSSDDVKDDSGSDEVTREARSVPKPVLISERSCMDRCLDSGVGKEDCAKKCDIDTHVTREARPVPVTIAARVDTCLEKCVESGVDRKSVV